MIDTKELRIGNLFQDEDKTPCYFAGAWERKEGWIYRDSAGNTYKDMQMYPMPLTTEILEKCGFKLDKAEDYKWYRKNNCPIQIFYDLEQVCYSAFLIDITIKSLHQLQNLVYALTQKELKIIL